MRFSTVKAAIVGWLDLSIPDRQLHFELVQALFSTPKSIFGATVAALSIVAITAEMTNDFAYTWLFVAFLAVGVGRSGGIFLHRRTRHDVNDTASTMLWERRALFGAWAFAGLVGLTGAYTVTYHPGTDGELLIISCVMGYIAGISSRNASRPLISIGQVSFTALPFCVALVARADLVHGVLAFFIAVLYVSITVICRAVFDNIVARQNAFRAIETIAKHDSLTGLWNRAAFIDLLEARLAREAQAGEIVALAVVDLDRFKDVNDTFGHQTGDTILREVGDRIKSVARAADQVARIGGDEFVVMLICANDDEAKRVIDKIFMTFSDPFLVGNSQHVCGASIGYAIASKDGATRGDLFRNADLALYEAKQGGRAKIVCHTTAITERYDRRMELEYDLQVALENNQMGLVYQPIVDPRSGRAICCEALIRWNHPKYGAISPVEFIPIAETTGLIVPIGAWVLATACAEAQNWAPDINVAVNLSPVQFRRGNALVQTVIDTLGKTGLPARRLELEITESMFIDDSSAALTVLEDLREAGIGISLDDFGTGFASLAYLNDFPFSKVKIDRKFCQDIESSPRTAAIIRGIAKTTTEMRIELVAEGIETESQLERIRGFGINAVQGFLFCRPLGPSELHEVIKAPIVLESAKRNAGGRRRGVVPARKVAS
jgi:diguanylate cyclase (GGDEF)-like protein